MNIDKGDLEIWHYREIVEDGEVEDENLQIAFSDAIKVEPDFEVGEEFSEQVKLGSILDVVRFYLFAKILFQRSWNMKKIMFTKNTKSVSAT